MPAAHTETGPAALTQSTGREATEVLSLEAGRGQLLLGLRVWYMPNKDY